MSEEMLKKIHKLQLEMMDEIDRICIENKLRYTLIAGSLIGAVRHGGFIPWDDDLDIAMPREDYEKFIEICKNNLSERFFIDSHETSDIYYRLAAKIRAKNTLYIEKQLINYKGKHGIWIDVLPLDYTVKKNSFKLKIQAALKSLLEVAIEKKTNIDISEKSIYKKVLVYFCCIIPRKKMISLQTKIMKLQNKKKCRYIVNLASKYGYKKQTFNIEDYFPLKRKLFEDRMFNIPNNYEKILKTIYGDYMKIPPKEKQFIHTPVSIKLEDEEEFIYEEM